MRPANQLRHAVESMGGLLPGTPAGRCMKQGQCTRGAAWASLVCSLSFSGMLLFLFSLPCPPHLTPPAVRTLHRPASDVAGDAAVGILDEICAFRPRPRALVFRKYLKLGCGVCSQRGGLGCVAHNAPREGARGQGARHNLPRERKGECRGQDRPIQREGGHEVVRGLMAAAASGEKGFKERARGSGERPIGAASCDTPRRHASPPPPPPARSLYISVFEACMVCAL